MLKAQTSFEFEIEFSPQNIEPGGTSELTYEITNLTGDSYNLSLVDTLPVGLVVGLGSFDASCAMTVNTATGPNIVNIPSIFISPFTNCTITVPVVAVEAGTYYHTASFYGNMDSIFSNTASLVVEADIEVTLEDSLVYDPSMDQIANPNDTIGYDLTIENKGATSVFDIDIENGSDPNTTLDPSTIRATPVAIDDHYELMTSPMNMPASIGVLANDADVNDPLPNPPFNENLTVLSVQGGLPGVPHPTENGGTITVMESGAFVYDTIGVAPSIRDSFYYTLVDSEGFEDSARVVISWTRPSVGADDFFNLVVNTANVIPVGGLFMNNGNGPDDMGIPEGVIVNFGGGDVASSTVVTDYMAGTTATLAGGDLTVNADGSFTLMNPTMTGIFTFEYRLENTVGFSDATVTVSINEGPTAQPDQYTFLYSSDQSVPSGAGLFADNGMGADDLGFPAAELISFGGGDLSGTVGSQTAGNTVALANGMLTVNADGSWSLTGQPFTPGTYTFQYRISNIEGTSDATVTLNIQDPPIAQADSFEVLVNEITNYPMATLFADNGAGADHLGTPQATITYFGGGDAGMMTGVTENAAGTTTSLAGGNLTVNADGGFILSNPTMTGVFTFEYRLENTVGFSDATVTVSINEGPAAQPDAYTFLYSSDQSVASGVGLFADNGMGADDLGFPAAGLTSFGGGDLNGTVGDQTAGNSVSLAGGTLTVNADGSWELTGQPFTPGTYTFQYRISNIEGTSDATVTLNIQDPPIAQADSFEVLVNEISNYPIDTLFADNGAGVDHLGTPEATIANFGGGDVAASTVVTDFMAGATATLAGGDLTVNADGSFTLSNPTMTGIFTFEYRLENTVGFSDATVTVSINEGPAAQPDQYTFQYSSNQTVASGAGLFTDNGMGADGLGFPAAELISFGGGDLSGTVENHMAGNTVALASGMLTVNADGSWTLTGQPFTPGTYTFQYRISNIEGTSDATVTLNIQDPPIAQADSFEVLVNEISNYPIDTLFADNGAGVDHLGTPEATIANFGGGDVAASTVVTDFMAGATATLAGGDLTVNSDGSFTLSNPTMTGIFTFEYRLENTVGFSDATVTVVIEGAPDGVDDSDAAVLAGTSSPGDNDFHIAMNSSSNGNINVYQDNGFGPDQLGYPDATTDLPTDVIQNIVLGGVAEGATGTIGGGAMTIGGSGSLEITISGDLQFTPPVGFSGLVTFEYVLANSIGTDPTSATVTLAVGNRPVAMDDAYTVTGNIPIQSTNVTGSGLLANDLGDDILVTAVNGDGANIGMPIATTSGGSVTVYSDGEFAYTPPVGYTGSDDFTYTISNGFGTTSSTTVTLTISDMIYFMDDQASAGGNGSFLSPFKTTSEHNAATLPTSSFLFVKDNGTAYPGNLELKSGETVIGEGATGNLFGMMSLTNIQLAPLSTVTGYSTSGDEQDWAEFTNTSGVGITLAENNTLLGISVTNTQGFGIADGGSNVSNLTVMETSVNSVGGAISIANGGTLDADFNELSTTGGGYGIHLVNAAGSMTNATGSITNVTTDAVSVSGGSVNVTVKSAVLLNTGSASILEVTNAHTGTVVLDTTLFANTSYTGDGIQLNSANGTYTISGLLSQTSGTAGVNIYNGSSGSLTIGNTNSQIRNVMGISFRVNQSSMNVTSAADIYHTAPNFRGVELIEATGMINFTRTISAGSNVTPMVSAEGIYMENNGITNLINFSGSVDITSGAAGASATPGFVSRISGRISVTRARLHGNGNIGPDRYFFDVSDTQSDGVIVEYFTVDYDDANEAGGGIRLTNTTGVFTFAEVLKIVSLKGIPVKAANFGTLNIGTTVPGSIASSDSAAIDVSNGVVHINATDIRSTNTYTNAIRMVDITGPGVMIPGNVTLSNQTTGDDLIYLENVDVMQVDLGTDAGSVVNLTNRTNNDGIEITTSSANMNFGTSVISNTTNGRGVYVHQNEGNVAFTQGGMNIVTNDAIGIFATYNNGSISVAGSGNTVTSGSTALNIDNTNIAATGLTFATINSSGSNNAGIILQHTGSAGGLQVTGIGSDTSLGGDGSGGTIAGKTGGDGSFLVGVGIYLNNTSHVVLRRMDLTGTYSNYAILGNTVTNLTLEYCDLSGSSGTTPALDEGTIRLVNLKGEALLNGTKISGGLTNNIRIRNLQNTTLDSLIVVDSEVGLNDANWGNDGLLVETLDNAVLNMRVSNTDFLGARGDLVQVNALGTSNVGVRLNNCDFTNNHSNIVSGGGGITLSGGSSSSNITYDYEVENCTLANAEGASITANFLSNAGQVTGSLVNNNITNSYLGIQAGAEKNGPGGSNIVHRVLIDDNTISGIDGDVGIHVSANGGASAISRAETYATITNNSVTNLSGFAFSGMWILAGGSAASGDFSFVCADVRDNTLDASSGPFTGNAVFVDQISTDASINFPSYTGSSQGEFASCGSGTASADLSAYMTGRGNVLTNGPSPGFAGGGVDATIVCDVTGLGVNCQ